MNPTSYRSALPHESHLLKQNVVEFLKSIKFYNISAYIAGKADIKMMQCCKFQKYLRKLQHLFGFMLQKFKNSGKFTTLPRFQGNPQYLKERNVVKSCKVSKKLQHFEIKEEIDRGIFSRAIFNCNMLSRTIPGHNILNHNRFICMSLPFAGHRIQAKRWSNVVRNHEI